MAYNTIRLMDYSNKFKERTLKVAAYAGMLMTESANAGEVDVASAGSIQKMFLFEKELEGKEIDTELTAGERVQIWFPAPGDEVYAILADGVNAVRGDILYCDGSGLLSKNGSAGEEVTIALEDVDTSTSSATGSEGPRGDYTRRIRVEVI